MDTIVSADGQSVYHPAMEAWFSGVSHPTPHYAWPSYDVAKLANALVAREEGRNLAEIRFYPGVPDESSSRFWHGFRSNEIGYLRNGGIYVHQGSVNSGDQERGVDVSLALDLAQAAHERRYDIAIIISRDADFGPAVRLARQIAELQNRTLKFESAFPYYPGRISRRGVPGTNQDRSYQAMYDAGRP